MTYFLCVLGATINLHLWLTFHLMISPTGLSKNEKTFKKFIDRFVIFLIVAQVGVTIYGIVDLYDGNLLVSKTQKLV